MAWQGPLWAVPRVSPLWLLTLVPLLFPWQMVLGHHRVAILVVILLRFLLLQLLAGLAAVCCLPQSQCALQRRRLLRRKAVTCIRGRVRARDPVSNQILVRHRFIARTSRLRWKQVYLQECSDFEVQTESGEVVRVCAEGAFLAVPDSLEATQGLVPDERLAGVFQRLLGRAPQDVKMAAARVLAAGTYVEVFGVLTPAADPRAREHLPRELPRGEELRKGPEGLVIHPVGAVSPLLVSWSGSW
jgi:hypothetical protein